MDGLVTAVPVPPSALIGRDGERESARSLLAAARVVTLVGPGGAGKTRLAIEVAAAHGGDVVFVDLAPVDDAGQVLPATARALGLRDGGARPLRETLHAHLRDRRLLVLLDNVEHVLAAGPDVADLLGRCAGLQVLATSRASLQLPGEHLLAVEPLPVPDPRDLPAPGVLVEVPSVALFVERVRAVCPGFRLTATTARTVAEICVALDGLPLALELAAAQVRPFGLDEVLMRTRSRFTLLRRPGWAVPERHRSLEGAVRGSVDRLDPDARALFGQLSVFSGGWTTGAADAVCRPDGTGLDQLVDHSLVVVERSGGGVRYRMLETLREWAAGVLDRSGEGPAARTRHTTWVAALAAQVGGAPTGPDEARWLDRAEIEHANIRTALERLPPGDPTALRIATDLSWFWDVRGHLREGRAHLERLLGVAVADPAVRAGALDALGRLATYQSDHVAADTALRESAQLSLELRDHPAAAWTLATLALSAAFTGRIADACPLAERAVALARPGGGSPLGRSLCALFVVRMLQGRHAEATATFADTLASFDDIGLAPVTWARARTLYFGGWAAHLRGDAPRAVVLLRESALMLDAIGDRRSMADCLDVLGCRAATAGDPAGALRRITVADGMRARAGVARHAYLAQIVAPATTAARASLGRQADRVVAGAQRLGAREAVDDVTDPGPTLTAREAEVARLVADGFTNRRIGRTLGISERTVERHLDHVRTKIGTDTRTGVALWAVSGTVSGSTDTPVP